MKKIVMGLAGLFVSLSILAQVSGTTVTINVMGNRNKQVSVDGNNYTISSDVNSVTGKNMPIMIPNLSVGQHTLEVINENPNRNDENTISTVFRIRAGYDMQITVRNNGTVQLKETKSKGVVSGHPGVNKTPMASSTFNSLLQNVRRQTRATTRLNLVSNAINTSSNYFTTAQAELLITQIASQANRVALLKAIYLKVTDAGNFTALYNDLLTTQSRRDEVAAHVQSYNYNAGGTGHNAGKTAMSAVNFNTIYSQAQSRQSTSRMNYILDAFANVNNYFTVAQARPLIELVSTESDRLILAKTSYRGIVDPANFFQVYDAFDSYTNRNDLASYVKSYNNLPYTDYPTTTTKTPMTTDAFNTMYRTVSNTWGLGAKMNSLTNIFANTSNYFTTEQARKLIGLVSAESNRLQLAKSAYKQLTDPENYNQLMTLLSSQSSKDELETYVETYARQ
jgi:hypothetical protein